MIEKERIEAAKSVDLVQLVKSRGIELKKKGKSYVGLCPFHLEATPSFTVNPAQNLWQCFGCGTGGDPIRFVELFDKVSFPEAVAKLDGSPPPTVKPAPPADKQPAQLSAKQVKLLARVIEFYHKAFCEDGRAREYLAGRGITDNSLFAVYGVGFANGTLLNVLPTDGDVIDGLKELGILNERGNEHFYGCATFPLYDLAGNPAGIYGRRIEQMDNGESPPHLYLPGPRRGLFNRQAAKSHKEIILTEAIIDSLTLINAGINNTIPCYGTNGLTADHLALFKQHRPESVVVAFDGDDTGKKVARSVAARLAGEGLRPHVVELPEDEDITSLFSLRLEELCSLTIYDVDLQGAMVRINKGKGKKDRVVPMGKHAVRFLKEYITKVRPHFTRKNRTERRLFIDAYGKPLSKEMTGISVRTYGKAARIGKQVTAHTFRHTFASGLIKNGADIVAVQKMMGHADLKTTEGYLRTVGIDLKANHKKSHPREKEREESASIKPNLERIRPPYVRKPKPCEP